MSTAETLRGILKPDGTLELEDSPHLSAGPVEIVIRPLHSFGGAAEEWWQYLQRVRAEAEAAGGPFRTAEEIETEREDHRSGDDRIDQA